MSEKGTLTDEICSIKDKFKEENSKKKRVLISFYKGDIKSVFVKKNSNKELARIEIPKSSKYSGYVWYYPNEWIYSNNNTKNKLEFSFSPDKRWINVPEDYQIKIIKSIKDNENHFKPVDELEISAKELKEEMKRPFTYYTTNNN